MMFPFLGEEDLDILTSEVKNIDGIEQVRSKLNLLIKPQENSRNWKSICLKTA